MRVFGIDTTRKVAKIIIYDDENNIKYVLAMGDGVKHSEGLFLYIEKALFENKLDIKDFDYYASIVGPGSFTGIRVGMATIKGFNKVVNKKVLPINTFEVVSRYIGSGVMLLSSTSTTCYYGEIKKGVIIDTGVVEKTAIGEKFAGKKLFALREEQNAMDLEYDNIEYIETLDDMYFDAICTSIQGEEKEFVPYYLQLSQAERNLKNE